MEANNESRGIATVEEVNLQVGKKASFQQFQDIYNEITGKKERLAKIFDNDHITNRGDIDQLNHKIKQTLEQYNLRSCNSSITIYHDDDSKEVFSSIERFMLYDQSKNSATENIHLEYNFLIKLPSANDARPYKVSIDVHSTAVIRNKILKQNRLGRILFGYPGSTGRFEIEYMDYAVAKNLQTVVENWFLSLPSAPRSKFISFSQVISGNFPSFFRLITVIVVSSYFYFSISAETWSNYDDFHIFRSAIFVFSTIYASSLIAFTLGRWTEQSVDAIQPISYVKLNQGDEKAYNIAHCNNKSKFINATLSSVGAIVLNILAAYLAKWIGV